jgi:hypothetical protein
MSELIGVGKSISDGTQDRAMRDENELATTLKELEHLRHLAEYYKSVTRTTMYLKGEFNRVYNKFKKERHGIRMVGKSSLDHMKRSTEYWAKMSWDPHREIQEKWAKCQKHWGKINKVMKDADLPEFDTHDEFINLSDVLKMHTKQDSLWAKECTKITDARLGKVKKFTEHPIGAQTMMQQLNTSLVKYRAHAVDIRGVYAAPMEQYRFPWAQTCEDLFINWSEYERSHPFQEISWVDC